MNVHEKTTSQALSDYQEISLREALKNQILDPLQAIVRKLCDEMPEGYVVSLFMEKGTSWVEAIDHVGDHIDFNDSEVSLTGLLESALQAVKDADRK